MPIFSPNEPAKSSPVPLRPSGVQRALGLNASVPVSDEEIVLGLTRGETRAAEQLYSRVHLHVQASLRRILRSTGPDYEDLVQASFEKILRTLTERALKSPYNLPGWASAVALRVHDEAQSYPVVECGRLDAAANCRCAFLRD